MIYALGTSGTNLFAGTLHGTLRSTDNGTTWTTLNTGAPSSSFAFEVSGTSLFAGTLAGVYRSTDNGDTWTAVNSGLPSNAVIRCFALSETNLFVGILGAGVYRSTDNGNTWTAVNSGLPPKDEFVEAFAVSGANLFAGTDFSGVFRSPDNGATWSAVNVGLPTQPNVHVLAVNGTSLFAGVGGAVAAFFAPMTTAPLGPRPTLACHRTRRSLSLQ